MGYNMGITVQKQYFGLGSPSEPWVQIHYTDKHPSRCVVLSSIQGLMITNCGKQYGIFYILLKVTSYSNLENYSVFFRILFTCSYLN